MEELVFLFCFTLVLTFRKKALTRNSVNMTLTPHSSIPAQIPQLQSNMSCQMKTLLIYTDKTFRSCGIPFKTFPGVKFRSSSSLTNIFLDPWCLDGTNSGCLRFHIDASSLPRVPINKDGRSGNVKTAWWLVLVSSLFLISIPQSSLKVGLFSLGTFQDWVSLRRAPIVRHREGVNPPSPDAAHGKVSRI